MPRSCERAFPKARYTGARETRGTFLILHPSGKESRKKYGQGGDFEIKDKWLVKGLEEFPEENAGAPRLLEG